MPRGGARPGAGRPRKPLSEKIASGNPGGHPLKKIDFGPDSGLEIKPPAYIDACAMRMPGSFDQRLLPLPSEIFAQDVEHLRPSGCLRLIAPELIAEHAVAKFNLLMAQFELGQTAITAVPEGAKEAVVTDYTKAMLLMQTNCSKAWQAIWRIVERNAEQQLQNPESDLMVDIIAARQRAKLSETGGK
jgi:hypothetical protein